MPELTKFGVVVITVGAVFAVSAVVTVGAEWVQGQTKSDHSAQAAATTQQLDNELFQSVDAQLHREYTYGQVINTAHRACQDLTAGVSDDQIVNRLPAGVDARDINVVYVAAATYYCPQYLPTVRTWDLEQTQLNNLKQLMFGNS